MRINVGRNNMIKNYLYLIDNYKKIFILLKIKINYIIDVNRSI